ncbi:MAG TPA: cupin domain-containing protein [Gammaproteobacteria bacterium]|nr:cupin domain-containing protein [Gammaproteobacteria bacterium]
MKTEYQSIAAFITKDGSLVRELMHPATHKNAKQSLAQAIIPMGVRTYLHRHVHSEELYHVTAGQGRMTLADEVFDVSAGDTLCINPGVAHCIENTGNADLVILCCCAPAYSHDDTELLE